MSGLDIMHLISSTNNFLALAGLCITLVKEAPDKMNMALAVASHALKDMHLITIKVLNHRTGLEKDINQCVPIFASCAIHHTCENQKNQRKNKIK